MNPMGTKHSSLESARQAILSKMQASREQYRRMLAEKSDQHLQADHHGVHPQHDMHAPSEGTLMHDSHGPSYGRDALSWAKNHPFLCLMTITAIVMFGPKRMARTVIRSGAALGALTLRNRKNIGMATRLISSIAHYIQRNRPPRHR